MINIFKKKYFILFSLIYSYFYLWRNQLFYMFIINLLFSYKLESIVNNILFKYNNIIINRLLLI